MRQRTHAILTILVVTAALVMVPTAAHAQMKLPDGVSFKVLAEFPSDIPGIEKVQLQEMTLQPGAKWENITIGDTGY